MYAPVGGGDADFELGALRLPIDGKQCLVEEPIDNPNRNLNLGTESLNSNIDLVSSLCYELVINVILTLVSLWQ